jgi:formylglycine-generating enzyme required for sulfatase activity
MADRTPRTADLSDDDRQRLESWLVEFEDRRDCGILANGFPYRATEPATLIEQCDSTSPADEPWGTSSPLPATLGRYTIIKRLGQGGMGSVYLAQDRQLERPVALKVPDFGPHEGPEARQRFLDEARTAAMLDHPYLCPMYDAEETDGRPYLAMAYIEGQPLEALIGARGWPSRSAAALVGKLALGMHEAHAKKVVHCDLKPANVMIRTTGPRPEPVIVDFGLAYHDDPDSVRVSRSGELVGTLDYMAPEQIRGDLDAIGPACDIYALGVMLYELLTGRLPFGGSGLAVAGQVLAETPLPPSAHRSDLDPAMEAICLKAMAKQVGDRYASMGELAAALAGYLASPPAPTIPALGLVAAPRPLPGGLRPRTQWVVAAVGLGVLLIGVTVLVTTNTGRIKIAVDGEKAVVKAPALNRGAEAGAEKRRESGPKPPTAVNLTGPQNQSARFREGEAPSESIPVPARGEPRPPRIKQSHSEPITNSIGMKLVRIPAGEFTMGMSPEAASDLRKVVEGRGNVGWFDGQFRSAPQHRVIFTTPWLMGVTEVTVGQFRRFVEATGYVTEAEQFGGGNSAATAIDATIPVARSQKTWRTPGYAVVDDSPVTQVTWNDAVTFCKWLSEQEKLTPCYERGAGDGWSLLATGQGYRLPTEAEWEYACQAGSTDEPTAADGLAWLDQHAWYSKNRNGGPQPVASKLPNGFGLYDTRGNVMEWCQDWYGADDYLQSLPNDPRGPSSGDHRVQRGGAWNYDSVHCHSGFRTHCSPSERMDHRGFRVVRVMTEAPSEGGAAGLPATSGATGRRESQPE